MLLQRIVLQRDDAFRSGDGKRYHFEHTDHELHCAACRTLNRAASLTSRVGAFLCTWIGSNLGLQDILDLERCACRMQDDLLETAAWLLGMTFLHRAARRSRRGHLRQQIANDTCAK